MNPVNPVGFWRGMLYLLVIGIVLLVGFLALSLIRLQRQEAAQPEPTEIPFVACNFTNTGADPIPLYSAPYSAPSLEIDRVPAGVPYRVEAVNNGYLYIELRDNYGGYIDQFRGVSTGNCEAVQREDRSTFDFPTVCRFTTTAQTPLYTDRNRTDTIRTLAADTRLVVMRQDETGYQVGLLSGLTGWVMDDAGELAGACGALPGPDA